VLHEATARGGILTGERRAEVEAVLDRALGALTPAERRRLVGLLARLNQELHAGAPTQHPALLVARGRRGAPTRT
jgi:hypothetical protein